MRIPALLIMSKKDFGRRSKQQIGDEAMRTICKNLQLQFALCFALLCCVTPYFYFYFVLATSSLFYSMYHKNPPLFLSFFPFFLPLITNSAINSGSKWRGNKTNHIIETTRKSFGIFNPPKWIQFRENKGPHYNQLLNRFVYLGKCHFKGQFT